MPLDFRKPHEIHGGGHGKDIVIQDGVMYTRGGQRLPQNAKAIANMGLPVTNEVRMHMEMARFNEEARLQRQKIEEHLQQQRDALMARIQQGESIDSVLSNDTPLPADDGLEDLSAQLEELSVGSKTKR